MKKYIVYTICLLCLLLLSACGKSAPVEEKPELSPLCPDGFLRIDSTKSCESIPNI